MNLFKKPKYLLIILLASLTFTTFVPQFSNAQAGTPLGTVGDVINRAVTAKVAPVVAAGAEATGNWLAERLGYIVWLLAIQFPAQILKLEIQIFSMVGPYNGFTTQTQVVSAWGTVRDLANMFFILILLLMAFGTILQVQGYGYRQLLSKLLLMAILVNFSKSIVAILIDFSQIVTLTFLAPVLSSLAGNIVVALGLQNIMSLREDYKLNNDTAGATQYNSVSYLMAMILGGIMMIITTVIIGVILIMFVMRIIGLWIMVILSPLAFLAKAFPKMSSYYSQWENELSKNLTAGPALAFFMWLAFSIVGQGNIHKDFTQVNPNASDQYFSNTVSRAADQSNMLNFVIAISLLMAGLKMAASSGAAGASMAGKASGSLQKWGSRLGRGATIGAAAGAGALAWRGTSGEGGVKGIVGQGRGAVGGYMAVGGQALHIGALQRGGMGLQTREDARKQRKEKYFAKRLEGMSQERKDEFLSTYGEVGLGTREARNIREKSDLKRGLAFTRIDPHNMTPDQLDAEYGVRNIADVNQEEVNRRKTQRAEEMRQSFVNSGDTESLELLRKRSAAALNDTTGHAFAQQYDEGGAKAFTQVDFSPANETVIDSLLALEYKNIEEIAESMPDKVRDSLMMRLQENKDRIIGATLTPELDRGNRNTALGKLSLLQGKFATARTGQVDRAAGVDAQGNAVSAITHSVASDYDALRASHPAAADSLRDSMVAQSSGDDVARLHFGSNVFNDVSGRLDATKLPKLLSRISRTAGGVQSVTENQVAAGNIENVLNNNLTRRYVRPDEIHDYVTTQIDPVELAARGISETDRRNQLALDNLQKAREYFVTDASGRARPAPRVDGEFVNFIENLDADQLKKVGGTVLRPLMAVPVSTPGSLSARKRAFINENVF